MSRNAFELSYNITGELVPLFKQELVACNLTPGETVALFCDSRTNPHYPAAFIGAAKDLGAHVFQICVPYLRERVHRIFRASSDDIIPPRGPLEAMKAADLVIDMSTIGWLYTHVYNEILESGSRILMVNNPPHVLQRLLPCAEVKKRTLAGAKVLSEAKTVRITSPAGTDLILEKTGRKAIYQYGAADSRGRWDHWPSGQVACAPLEGSAEGTLVLDIGDIVLRLERYMTQPVKFQIKGGRIVRIEGGLEAYLIREYMNAWNDERAFIPAHVGWGTEHRANWFELALPGPGGNMDAESFYGNVLIGFGANYFVGLGGTNVTPAHIDFCLRNCDLWVDDLQVLHSGQIVPEDLK